MGFSLGSLLCPLIVGAMLQGRVSTLTVRAPNLNNFDPAEQAVFENTAQFQLRKSLPFEAASKKEKPRVDPRFLAAMAMVNE